MPPPPTTPAETVPAQPAAALPAALPAVPPVDPSAWAAAVPAASRRTGSAPSPRPRPATRPRAVGGLTTAGVAVLLSLVTGVALVLDLLIGPGLGWIFGVGFVLGCGWVALRVRRRDELAALAAPPLVFAAAVLVADELVGAASPGRFPLRQVLDLATSLAVGAPQLLSGCAVAAAVVMVRRWRDPLP